MLTAEDINGVLERLSEAVPTGADIPLWVESESIDQDAFDKLIVASAITGLAQLSESDDPAMGVAQIFAQGVMLGFELHKRQVPDAELPDPDNVTDDPDRG